ncbi:MAG TPA: hypothetical protein VF212_08695 [Longimicrobiales bacterium]
MTRPVERISFYATAIGTAVTLASAYAIYFSAASSDARVGMVLVSVFAALALALLVWQEYRYARKTRYAEAINNVLALTRATVDQPCTTIAECEKILHAVVREAAESFTLITGTRVSACLKMVVARETDAGVRCCVEDVCRDATSASRIGDARAKARVAGAAEHVHWIDGNTDFNKLFLNAGRPQGRYYLANFLPSIRHYNNFLFK